MNELWRCLYITWLRQRNVPVTWLCRNSLATERICPPQPHFLMRFLISQDDLRLFCHHPYHLHHIDHLCYISYFIPTQIAILWSTADFNQSHNCTNSCYCHTLGFTMHKCHSDPRWHCWYRSASYHLLRSYINDAFTQRVLSPTTSYFYSSPWPIWPFHWISPVYFKLLHIGSATRPGLTLEAYFFMHM